MQLRTTDAALERVMTERRPFSLCWSVTPILPRVLAAAAVLAISGLVRGWVIASLAVALVVVVGSLFTTRRIDVDTGGLTFVPLFPFIPTQRLRFESIGTFEVRRSRYPSVRAPVDSTATYK